MTLEALCRDVLIYDTFNAADASAASAGMGELFRQCTTGGGGTSAGASQANSVQQGQMKRRRRQRSTKNADSQQITHIAVERNRRRQVNEYLAALRSLMLDSYVHRVRNPTLILGRPRSQWHS
jgi:uncharacterized protein YaiL (DUF2058 family)